MVPFFGWIACRAPEAAVNLAGVPITVLALNDFHGGLYEAGVKGDDTRRYGGLPWLVAAVGHVRRSAPHVLLLDGGDAFQGSWPVNATYGRGSVEAFELLGVDASAVGNHEFDYGGAGGGDPRRGALERAAAAADYPLLTANVRRADGARWAPPNVKPWTVLQRGGVRIGVVGLSTETTPTVTNPKNVSDLTFVDPVQAVRELLPEIEAADLDVTVLVGHLTGRCAPVAYTRNDDACVPDGEIGRLLTELPEGTFDVMVLGHAHTVLHHRVGQVFLLENRSLGHLLGRVDLVVGEDGVVLDASTVHDPWPIAHAPSAPGCDGGAWSLDPQDVGGVPLAPDPDAIALVDRLEAEAGSLCDELTCASRALYRVNDAESDLGDWLADAMRAAFPAADLAVQNSGGIRADLPEGTVRRESLQRIMPFDNHVLLVEMSGAQVRTMFRIGASGAHGLLQVSGAAYTVDPDRSAHTDLDGDRALEDFERDHLCSVEVAGQPLDDARIYRVATSDFLFNGGDDLGVAFRGATIVEEGPLLRDVFALRADATDGCIGDAPLVRPEAPRIQVATCR